MKKTLLFFFALLSINCFSQFSKTHYIPPLTCANNLAGDQYRSRATSSLGLNKALFSDLPNLSNTNKFFH